MRKIFFQVFLFGLIFIVPSVARAISVDVGFNGGARDIFFSKEKLIVGDPVRIYASVHNFGDVDVSASVLFYQGVALIDEAKPVSVRAKGLSDEVYVDWIVPEGSFNIRAEVKGQSPAEQNSANDTALTSLLTAEKLAPPPALVSQGVSGSLPFVGSSGTQEGTGGGTKSVGNNKSPSELGTRSASVVALVPPLSPVNEKERGRVAAAESTGAPFAPALTDAQPAVNDLLKVYIDIRQLGWNTFRFTADVNRPDNTSYVWSFGDGKTARGKEVNHAYTFAGRYIASVVAVHEDGERAQEKATLDISFWHLGNWQLAVVLLLLVGFAVLLLGVTRRKKEEHEEDRSAVEEGEMPPVLLAEENRVHVPTKTPKQASKKKRKSPVRKKRAESSLPPPPEIAPPSG